MSEAHNDRVDPSLLAGNRRSVANYQATHDVAKPLDGFPPAKRNQMLYDICVKIANAVET